MSISISRAFLPPILQLPTTLIEKRAVRYSKIMIFQSFLLRFGCGFRLFIHRKLFYNAVLSSRKDLHCCFIAKELLTSYLIECKIISLEEEIKWERFDVINFQRVCSQ